MTPSQLVEANVALQKMHSECSDLASVEIATTIESVLFHLEAPERAQVLEYARDLAMRRKTSEVRAYKEILERSGIAIDGEYIEKQLSNCRHLLSKSQTASIGTTAYGSPIWGAASVGGDVVNIMDAKKH
jgi:hypothetical protein